MPTAISNPFFWWRSGAIATAWAGALVLLASAYFIVVRGCEYDSGAVITYALYFGVYVLGPGAVAVRLVLRRPLSLTTAIALGIPTGFALEIFSFLGLSAFGAREWLRFVPVVWLAAAVWLRWRGGMWPVRCRLTGRHALLALALSGLFLWMVLLAASQMYAESPLVGGLPQRPIFHDWVYLLSRAATIKQHWPLEDPSLAGTSLQYHYFMLVHAAAASWLTKLELGTVLLRLMIVPLGAVLVVQAYALGRLVSRHAWGGVIAAWLTVAATEVSFVPRYGEAVFLGLFTRWLYVSPTFFFGMVFFGGLLLAVARLGAVRRVGVMEYGWLALLAAAGTGAKGTVLPVLLLALVFWAAWRWWSDRRPPWRMATMAAAMGAAFAAVYFATMSAWGGGQAAFEPLHVYQITPFWRSSFPRVEHWLAQWLPGRPASALAAIGCAAVVFAGTCGVRLLAIPYLLRVDVTHRRHAVGWLAAVTLAGGALGSMLHLEANGELYLILLIRLPLAVLAAAFVVSMATRAQRAWQAARRDVMPGPARAYGARAAEAGFGVFATAGLTLVILAQSGTSVLRQREGWGEWLRLGPEMSVPEDMVQLREVMLWIRQHTGRDAVLVANAFTTANLERGRGRLVDHTTAGVHYYYSAISERRLWVEGPTYLLEPAKARDRMQRAAVFFAGQGSTPAAAAGSAPGYALIDLSLGGPGKIALPASARVFANARFEVYRLPREPADQRVVAATP